ncbi:MAG: helix-turn-helix domain containing protein [Thaumarchaeota archaeon]|nr:helix-turn-helix domain containing protein [Nitrososphaerota archaeon]
MNSAIRTKDLKVRTRLMAVRAVLESGHSENMAAVFDVTARCIRQWVERFRAGPEGLRDKPKSGKPKAVPTGDIRQAAAELHQKTSPAPKRLR